MQTQKQGVSWSITKTPRRQWRRKPRVEPASLVWVHRSCPRETGLVLQLWRVPLFSSSAFIMSLLPFLKSQRCGKVCIGVYAIFRHLSWLLSCSFKTQAFLKPHGHVSATLRCNRVWTSICTLAEESESLEADLANQQQEGIKKHLFSTMKLNTNFPIKVCNPVTLTVQMCMFNVYTSWQIVSIGEIQQVSRRPLFSVHGPCRITITFLFWRLLNFARTHSFYHTTELY